MTDPGWAIPGVPRDVPPSADEVSPRAPGTGRLAGAGSSARAGSPASGDSRGRRARSPGGPRRPPASASALTGSCAGAFARAGASVPPPRTGSSGSPAATGASVHAGPVAEVGAATAPYSARPAARTHDDAVAADAITPPAGAEAADPVQALALLRAGLDFLAHADPAEWPAGLQADCLRALAVAEAQQAAAHAKVLAAFSVPGGGLAGDGHASARVWLTWQTQATRRAAVTHVTRMKSLGQHPRLAAALAGGTISLSWARQLADWSDRLPEQHRDDADQQFLDAAANAAGLADLFFLAEQQRRDHATPDTDDDTDDGFEDRGVQFATTFGGAGRIEGNLTPRCAAAVDAAVGSLSAKRGPEDDRTLAQRQHDALEEACTRLIAAGGLPERAGQPVRLELTITLDELARNGEGSAAGPGAACDAAIQPVITGIVDHDLLQQLADPDGLAGPGQRSEPAETADNTAAGDRAAIILAQAIALLSGPTGQAARLRRRLGGPAAAGISLPLDIAGVSDTIPVHLRRAVRTRDRHCRFPGCDMPAAGCDVHHLIHRQDRGPNTLTNLALFCRFHHQIAIHRWGWHITLHPDGTTTAVSPDGTKTLHSLPPPKMAV